MKLEVIGDDRIFEICYHEPHRDTQERRKLIQMLKQSDPLLWEIAEAQLAAAQVEVDRLVAENERLLNNIKELQSMLNTDAIQMSKDAARGVGEIPADIEKRIKRIRNPFNYERFPDENNAFDDGVSACLAALKQGGIWMERVGKRVIE